MTRRATKPPIRWSKNKAAVRSRRRGRRLKVEQTVPMVLGRARVAEQPARSRLQVHPRWLALGLGMILLVGLGLTLVYSPRFRVAEPEVVGASRIAAATIVDASGLRQQHILAVNERQAESRILVQMPSLAEAHVDCHLPADCVISVVERPLLLTWESESGLVWVDGAGGTFPAGEPLVGSWLVHGPLPLDAHGRVERAVLEGLADLTQLGIRPGNVTYRPGRGLVLDDPAGWRVVVGQGRGMARRLQVYALVRQHLLDHSIRPRFVDVRFPDAPYYSVENDW